MGFLRLVNGNFPLPSAGIKQNKTTRAMADIKGNAANG